MSEKVYSTKYKELPCKDPEHNPPAHLYIPTGESYIHTCPSCGRSLVIHGSNISF